MATQELRDKLYEDFLKEFPLESLKDMTLEKYTNLNREDSFCYWIESKTYKLGSIWGGSSYKFGIYQYAKKPNNPTIIVSDDKYAWYKWYNVETRDEAYKLTLSSIVNIAEAATEGRFMDIDNDTTLGEVLRWKIAFLYSHKQLIPIYKRTMLEDAATALGLIDAKNTNDFPFTDVEEDRWSRKAIEHCYNAGLVNGKGNNIFDPAGTLTREELCQVLYKFAKKMEENQN